MATRPVSSGLPNGPVAAALIAGGIGSTAISIVTLLTQANASVANALAWYAPVGSLSGQIGIGLIAYFASWIVLHLILRGKNVNFARATMVALFLLVLGLLGTFPPFFSLFAGK
jgi:hypothetical protein